MAIIRVSKAPNQFSIIDRTAAEDSRLSFKAKGMMFYLLTKPDNWTVNVTDLVRRSADGRDSVYAGLKELKEAGYIIVKDKRSADGKYEGAEYVVFENPIIMEPTEPLTENPHTVPLTENPHTAKPNTEKPDHSNNDLNDIDLNDIKEEEDSNYESLRENVWIQIFGNQKPKASSEDWLVMEVIENKFPVHIAKAIAKKIDWSQVSTTDFFSVMNKFKSAVEKGSISNYDGWLVKAFTNEQGMTGYAKA